MSDVLAVLLTLIAARLWEKLPIELWSPAPGASRSYPVRPPAWDAAWPPVAVLRSRVAPRQALLHRLGFDAPQEIVTRL